MEAEYVKVVVPKSESAERLIYEAISTNILFKNCAEEELRELIEAFVSERAPAGSTIVRQGDEGGAFYVLEGGNVDVYEGESLLRTLRPGASFGEIALLYGCPRSATLRARDSCRLWSISRAAFRGITSQFKKRRTREKVGSLKKARS